MLSPKIFSTEPVPSFKIKSSKEVHGKGCLHLSDSLFYSFCNFDLYNLLSACPPPKKIGTYRQFTHLFDMNCNSIERHYSTIVPFESLSVGSTKITNIKDHDNDI